MEGLVVITLRRSLKALGWLVAGNASQRRRVRQEMARMSAAIFGDFPISDDHKAWREDREFRRKYRTLSPMNPYSEDRKWTLREFVLATNSLPGDLAECGCYEGASAYFMAEASTHGSLLLFDSFEGISEPGKADREKPRDALPWQKGDLRSTEEALRANLAGFNNVEVFSGWIPQRFGDVAMRNFRLVHIDVDLYQPTKDSLEFFFPRLVPGGVIVMDDYGLLTCPGARKAADEFSERQGTRVLHLPTGQGVLIKGKT